MIGSSAYQPQLSVLGVWCLVGLVINYWVATRRG
jgi:hypothetical protein